ncbi:MAG: cytochrome c oxidase accessory protein CcoG [Oligoflexia bacterium]|nr:cytochrome c oxidase accessory protein CcoG [Oligoflexia bacterium]
MDDHFRETLYTIDTKGRRKWVYAHLVAGKFIKSRAVVAYLLMALYLLMPWISINGKQGVLLNIYERRFIFFGLELWATDTIFLFLTLGFFAITLFFVTAMLGRLWCGWACPETVFLEFLFRPIERLIEGPPAKRIRLDQQPWNFEKIFKKGLKHLLCAAFAWVLASTALAYFIGREPLLAMMEGSPLDHLGPFVMTLILMGVMGFQFGWFREQFCTVLCPYARFQSVMMDQDSLVIGYDPGRGEPRGKAARGAKEPDNGDCIDCGLCVRVCPTGIDIRNGLQLECVACAACVDACNSIMDKMGWARGLIRYDTENRLQGRTTHFLRPRLFVYATLLVLYLSAFGYFLSVRQPDDLEVVRATKETPFTIAENVITNHFTMRLSNKSDRPMNFKLAPAADPRFEVVLPLTETVVMPGKIQELPLFVRFGRGVLDHGKGALDITVSRDGAPDRVLKAKLLGPNE